MRVKQGLHSWRYENYSQLPKVDLIVIITIAILITTILVIALTHLFATEKAIFNRFTRLCTEQ